MNMDAAVRRASFASNGIHLLFPHTRWRPTDYACVDTAVLPDSRHILNKMTQEEPQIRFFFPREMTPHSDEVTDREVAKYIQARPNVCFFETENFQQDGEDFQVFSAPDSVGVTEAMTVTIVLMQLAVKMGYRRLFLIGCDTNYRVPANARNLDAGSARVDHRLMLDDDNDPNHFDPCYFGRGRVWHTPNVDLMVMHYELAKKKCDEWGIEVFNAGLGGSLEVFPRVEFKQVLDTWS